MEKLEEMDWDLEDADTDIYTSQIHPYPAKFIPQIPHRFIEEFSEEGDVVLDPFNGSGTTTMMSAVEGRKGYGCDLNPLACLISRAKVRDYKIEKLIENYESLISDIEEDMETLINIEETFNGEVREIEGIKVNIPDFSDRYEWFLPQVANQIGLLNHKISNISSTNLRTFYYANLSAILKRVSRSNEDYTFIGDNMLPTSDSNNLTPDNRVHNVLNEFKRKSKKNIKKVEDLMNEEPATPKIKCIDFREFNIDEDIDLCITSPPYACAVDYARYHRLSFYWLGFPLRETRDKEIGARSKRGRKNAVGDYFQEMKEAYSKVYSHLRDGGKFIIVVGDSQRKKKELEVPKETLKICQSIGFNHIDTLTRHISQQTMGQKKIKEEKIFILEK